jgi:dipeptidyl aminopeptidase/acylaminoacyl peptidase
MLLASCTTTQAPPKELELVPQGERFGNLVVSGAPAVPEEVRRLLAPFSHVRNTGLFAWSGDDLLVGTRFAETTQVHRLDRPMGARRQVTFFDEPVLEVAVPSDGSRFVYLRDEGGSEFYQIFEYDWASGQSQLRSNGTARYGGLAWSRAGDRFAYSTTERNGTNIDLHVQDLAGVASVALETSGGMWGVLDWSPDDSRLLVQNYVSINESYLYELELATGELVPVVDPTVRTSIGIAAYGEDDVIYFSSDMGAEFQRLHRRVSATGAVEVVTGDVDWDVELLEVSPDRTTLAFTINEGGLSRLVIWHLPERRRLALPAIPDGIISTLAFSANSTRLAFSLASPVAPQDVYSVDLRKRVLTRWTEGENGGLDPAAAVAPAQIEYPTFDIVDGAARTVPAFLFRPAGAGPHPVLIDIHGGPEAQYRPYFSPFVQALVQKMGVAVIAPNVRGSHGYGKTYLELDNGVLREDSVKDIGALLDWVATRPDLDPNRVGVLGGSYGGYMVLASLVHYGERIAAGVERVGISNFVTFLRNTQDYRRDLRRAEYGDERDPAMHDFLQSISPLNHVDRINQPLMISQGLNDPRVPASESAQLVAALASRDVPAWYLVATDEGHGFRKKRNRDREVEYTWMFLETWLKGADAR